MWKGWLPSHDPLFFGYVPQLWTLVLSNRGTIWHKSFKLSEFLGNVVVGELDLDFQCERVRDDKNCTYFLFFFKKNSDVYFVAFVDGFHHYVVSDVDLDSA